MATAWSWSSSPSGSCSTSGLRLDVEPDEEVDLPDIPGLGTPDYGSLLGVILSHPHQDHYGLATQVAPSVPIYTGKAAAAILEAAAFFTNSGVRLRPAGFLGDRRAFTTGPFTVTPHLVDHSGFDSYAPEEHGVPLVHLRSSGHAPVEDLRALAGAIAPTRVVPIHTSAPEQFTSHFENVEAHADGEWWNV